MDSLVQQLEAVTESIRQLGNPVQLGIMRAHHRAVVTNQRLRIFAVEIKRFAVNRTRRLHLCLEASLCGHGALGERHLGLLLFGFFGLA